MNLRIGSLPYFLTEAFLVRKRSVDITLSFAFLALVSPILLAAAVVILLDSPGPILFRQKRMGRGFREFQLYKLRTMAAGCRGTSITLGKDARITRAGRLLRQFKIDELPQLWNVLRGEMSLVGPRPVIPELTKEYHDAYALLLRVRPGLTDPATLRYANETDILATVSNPLEYFKTVVMRHKLRLSTTYMKNSTFRSDIGCILMTVYMLVLPPVRMRLSRPILASMQPCQSALSASVRRPVVSAERFGGTLALGSPSRTPLSLGMGVGWAERSLNGLRRALRTPDWSDSALAGMESRSAKP